MEAELRSMRRPSGKSRFMKKYFVLYMAPMAEFQKLMAASTPEQSKGGMDAWMKWSQAHKGDIVDMGAPVGKTKRVSTAGATDTKNEIGGYSIVQAESHDAATKLFTLDHPHFWIPGAWVEVMEIMEMPGM